jgi:hypothetical protein
MVPKVISPVEQNMYELHGIVGTNF